MLFSYLVFSAALVAGLPRNGDDDNVGASSSVATALGTALGIVSTNRLVPVALSDVECISDEDDIVEYCTTIAVDTPGSTVPCRH
jgi:hypothetical protein